MGKRKTPPDAQGAEGATSTEVVVVEIATAEALEYISLPAKNIIQGLQEEYRSFKIEGTGDKDAIKKAEEGVRGMRTLRGQIEARRKEVVEPALRFQREVNDQAKALIGSLQELEDGLKTELARIEAIKADEKAAAAVAAAVRFNGRTQHLFESGATFNGNIYALGSAFATPEQIRDAADDAYQEILSRFRSEAERLQKEAAEAEARRKAEAELAAAQRRQQEEERMRLQREMEKAQADKRAAEAAAKQAISRERAAELKALGFIKYEDSQGQGMWIEGMVSSKTSRRFLEEATDDAWRAYLQRVRDAAEHSFYVEEEAANKGAELLKETAVSAFVKPQGKEETPETPEIPESTAVVVRHVLGRVRAAFLQCKSRTEFAAFLDSLEEAYK